MLFSELLDNYVAVLIGAGVGFMLVATALIGNAILAPRLPSARKRLPYECGMLPIGRNILQIHFRYYLFGILFLIFDVEAVFLFPWVVGLASVGQAAFWEMAIFIVVLFSGLAYAWKKGVLQWR